MRRLSWAPRANFESIEQQGSRLKRRLGAAWGGPVRPAIDRPRVRSGSLRSPHAGSVLHQAPGDAGVTTGREPVAALGILPLGRSTPRSPASRAAFGAVGAQLSKALLAEAPGHDLCLICACLLYANEYCVTFAKCDQFHRCQESKCLRMDSQEHWADRLLRLRKKERKNCVKYMLRRCIFFPACTNDG